MIRIKRINKEEVKPVKFVDVKEDPRPVRGRDIFPDVYCNIFFCARKKSGKTCAIAHIIDKCATIETRVIAFVSTIHRDPTWRAIKDMCERKKIEFTGFTSIKDESSKEDILGNILKTLGETSGEPGVDKEDKEEETVPSSAIVRSCILTNDDPEPGKRKPKKPKENAPKIIFIFDDLSGELHAPSITTLLKTGHRHYKCKTLISSQYWNDIALQGRRQIDYVLLYRGLSKSLNKLEDIYKNLSLSIPFEQFVDLYRFCTSKKFNFMYIDGDNSEFRKNFNDKIELPKDDGDEDDRDL